MNEKPGQMLEVEPSGSKLIQALLKARDEFKPIKKDAENPYFSSKYATLSAYLDATLPALTKNGIHVRQAVIDKDGRALLATTLFHSSGETLECGEYPLTPVKPDPQSMGSCVSYGRRYSYAAALGLHAEDDDANEASKKPEAKAAPAKLSSTVSPKKPGTITEEQRQMIISTMKDEGHSKGTVLAIIEEMFNVHSTADVPADGFDKLIIRLRGGDPEGEK